MKKSGAVSAVLFSLLLWSCGGDDASPTTPTTTPKPTPVATSVTLSVTSLSLASLGVTSQLSATVKDQSGATMASATVTWATSDAAVATVSSAGLVTSVADGTVTITATSGSLGVPPGGEPLPMLDLEPMDSLVVAFSREGIQLINDYGQGSAPFDGGTLISDADGNVDGFGSEHAAYKAANFASMASAVRRPLAHDSLSALTARSHGAH
jgi:hypothetical protein